MKYKVCTHSGHGADTFSQDLSVCDFASGWEDVLYKGIKIYMNKSYRERVKLVMCLSFYLSLSLSLSRVFCEEIWNGPGV